MLEELEEQTTRARLRHPEVQDDEHLVSRVMTLLAREDCLSRLHVNGQKIEQTR